jgi:hypothetical protein
MPNGSTFEKWFDRLARNKMQGPAVATAGMAVGLLVMSAGILPWKAPIGDILTGVGLTQVAASSLLFIAFAVLQLRMAIRHPQWQSAPHSPRSRLPDRRKSRAA